MDAEPIIGRSEEASVVVDFLEREPSGASGLLIEGKAGIGKTTMWREAVRIARTKGVVLSSRASEAEVRLAFTVLGDLFVPALNDELLARLSAASRRRFTWKIPGSMFRVTASSQWANSWECQFFWLRVIWAVFPISATVFFMPPSVATRFRCYRD